MKSVTYLLGILLFCFGLTMNSCQKEDSCDATWDTNVEPIIASSCSYSGCHSGDTTASTFLSLGSKDYTNYAGIKASLDNGAFKQRVLISKDMPSVYAPQSRPQTLTNEQLDILQCWVDAGFPEN